MVELLSAAFNKHGAIFLTWSSNGLGRAKQ